MHSSCNTPVSCISDLHLQSWLFTAGDLWYLQEPVFFCAVLLMPPAGADPSYAPADGRCAS